MAHLKQLIVGVWWRSWSLARLRGDWNDPRAKVRPVSWIFVH